jgi:hypothetical protein
MSQCRPGHALVMSSTTERFYAIRTEAVPFEESFLVLMAGPRIIIFGALLAVVCHAMAQTPTDENKYGSNWTR